MSFFYELCKCFNIDDLSAKTTITTILGYGIMIVGKIKIKDIQEDTISLISNKEKITVLGKDLVIKSISKGELIVSGIITDIKMENIWKIM